MTRLIDLTGKKYHLWTVLERGPIISGRHSLWKCICDCGTERIVDSNHLRSGHSKSCGCHKAKLSSERLSSKLEGTRSGKLTAIERVGTDVRNNALWRCVCDCGGEVVVPATKLTSAIRTESCGCLFRERITTHGKSRTRTYRIWMKMRQRCYNPNQSGYQDYGGRGIAVCDEWMSFANFHKDMGDAPDGYSLDRIDFNGNYERENCRWATRKQQAQNTRRNKVVEINGKRMLLTEAIELLRRTATPLQ